MVLLISPCSKLTVLTGHLLKSSGFLFCADKMLQLDNNIKDSRHLCHTTFLYLILTAIENAFVIPIKQNTKLIAFTYLKNRSKILVIQNRQA